MKDGEKAAKSWAPEGAPGGPGVDGSPEWQLPGQPAPPGAPRNSHILSQHPEQPRELRNLTSFDVPVLLSPVRKQNSSPEVFL